MERRSNGKHCAPALNNLNANTGRCPETKFQLSVIVPSYKVLFPPRNLGRHSDDFSWKRQEGAVERPDGVLIVTF